MTRLVKTFEEISPIIKPLDLILFRGTDIVSDLIRVIEKVTTGNGDFSHSGVVVNREILPSVKQLQPNRWYVMESTFTAVDGLLSRFSDGTPDIRGEGRFGVQIRDLESVVKTYTGVGGEVAWAPLLKNPWDQVSSRKRLIQKVSRFHQIIGDRTYDMNCLSLLAVVVPCLRKPRNLLNQIVTPDGPVLISWDPEEVNEASHPSVQPGNETLSGWLFCSELTALLYQKVGLIDKKFDPQDAMPVDFLGVDQDGIPRLVSEITHLVFSSKGLDT